MASVFVQQRPRMSKDELRARIDEAVSQLVPGSKLGGPNTTVLRKASQVSDEIMRLVEEYTS